MRNILILFILTFSSSVFAQELNCQVSVIISPSLQMSANDLEIVKDLETNIYEFMNTTRWTKDNFEIEERVDCNILITLTEKSGSDGFGGKIQVKSLRPVYNTSYSTTVFNFVDPNFNIVYLRNTALIFSIEQYRNNLTSILGFYAYMILAYDYDSFSLEGGSEYLNNNNLLSLSIEINENFTDQYQKVLKLMKENKFNILHKKNSYQLHSATNSKHKNTFNYVFVR